MNSLCRRLACALIAVVAVPGRAGAATKTYSTGTIHQAIPDDVDRLWPVGSAYIRKLRSFLRETGYGA